LQSDAGKWVTSIKQGVEEVRKGHTSPSARKREDDTSFEQTEGRECHVVAARGTGQSREDMDATQEDLPSLTE
jgi:hypothetical protein